MFHRMGLVQTIGAHVASKVATRLVLDCEVITKIYTFQMYGLNVDCIYIMCQQWAAIFGIGHQTLTHWGRDKMAAILQMTFQMHFLEWKCMHSIENSLKFVPKSPINNVPALFQIMACCRPGDKPLSETMMVRLPMHICVTQPQWLNW